MTSRYNRGYYASSDLRGVGDMDLYRITFTDERDPVAELMGFVRQGEELVPAKSKITLKSLDESEVISDETDTLEGDYFLLLGHGKTYDMIVETERFAPYHRQFDIPEQKEYFQLYQEIHHVHLYDSDGNIIGQQITVYNALGETDTSQTYYDEETIKRLNLIKNDLGIHGMMTVLSDVKFYMSEDSLLALMRKDSTLSFDFGDNVLVSFMEDENDDKLDENWSNDS